MVGIQALMLLLTLGLLLVKPAAAYEREVHFFTTLILAEHCGLDVEEGRIIAWANQRTDADPLTSPLAVFNLSARSALHFRTTLRPNALIPTNNGALGVQATVIAGSKEARAVVQEALNRASAYESKPGWYEPILLGIGLHAYQDSWAHEGTEPYAGHLFSGFFPDNPAHQPEKALEMAFETWKVLDEWSSLAHRHGCVRTWADISPEFDSLVRLPGGDREAVHLVWKILAERILGRSIGAIGDPGISWPRISWPGISWDDAEKYFVVAARHVMLGFRLVP